MKHLALVAVLVSVVSLPAFAQSKYIKNANPQLTVTESVAQLQAEKGNQVDLEKQADAREEAVDATGEAETEAPATGEAAMDADDATGETARDAATSLEKPEAEQ